MKTRKAIKLSAKDGSQTLRNTRESSRFPARTECLQQHPEMFTSNLEIIQLSAHVRRDSRLNEVLLSSEKNILRSLNLLLLTKWEVKEDM